MAARPGVAVAVPAGHFAVVKRDALAEAAFARGVAAAGVAAAAAA